MKLKDEKIDRQLFFSVGYDNLSESYLLSVMATYVG